VDAFGVLSDVLDDYKSFVQGFLNIRDPDVLVKVEQEVANGLMWRLVKQEGTPTHTLTSYYRPEHVEYTPIVDPKPGTATW
jgi:hypothetical protein